MKTNDLSHLRVRAKIAPVVEIDPPSRAVYIRFSSAKVHKTIADDRREIIVAVDLDSKGQIIGIELVGVQNISIKVIRQALPTRLQSIDFESATFAPASSPQPEPVLA